MKHHVVWLPRQDQLPEMVFGSEVISTGIVQSLWEFCRENSSVPLDSMEQLWLAFVMKEKFGKTWAGDKWEVVTASSS